MSRGHDEPPTLLNVGGSRVLAGASPSCSKPAPQQSRAPARRPRRPVCLAKSAHGMLASLLLTVGSMQKSPTNWSRCRIHAHPALCALAPPDREASSYRGEGQPSETALRATKGKRPQPAMRVPRYVRGGNRSGGSRTPTTPERQSERLRRHALNGRASRSQSRIPPMPRPGSNSSRTSARRSARRVRRSLRSCGDPRRTLVLGRQSGGEQTSRPVVGRDAHARRSAKC